MSDTNWSQVSNFFNGVIEEAAESWLDPSVKDAHLEVSIYSPSLGDTLSVVILERQVEDFMKALPLFEAEVITGYPESRA